MLLVCSIAVKGFAAFLCPAFASASRGLVPRASSAPQLASGASQAPIVCAHIVCVVCGVCVCICGVCVCVCECVSV
jgi:hypothetical protein